jgi:hypothetical protein
MNAARRFLLPLVCVACLPSIGRGQQLPKKSAAADMQKEAASLIDGLPILLEPPAKPGSKERVLSVEQAEARLAEAKRKQERWTKLAKQGVLSKSEAEGCAVEVAQANLRCANAHLARAQEAFDGADKNAAAAGDSAAALETAKTAAAEATANLNQTRLQVAQANLQRFRQLYAWKLLTKAQLQQMEARVTSLQVIAAGQ